MMNLKKLKRLLLFLLMAVGIQQGLLAQNSQGSGITGRVSSSEGGETLPGATVRVIGTNTGTVTDENGTYTLNIPQNVQADSISVSYIGFLSQRIAINGRSVINVSLQPNVNILSDVVVVGYGTVQRQEATGSVATIDSASFNKGVVNSPQELLMGKTAGVVVTTNSGAPGNASTIRIRGGASLNASNDPLIVIDGVPITNSGLGGSPNILATLNPNDIETFTVLKDASATAIYGARASNGVIIITTKGGQKEFQVNYSLTGTMYTTPKTVDVYSGDEFRALLNEQFPGNAAVLGLLGDANTDWQDEIYQTAFGQDHALSFSGAVKTIPYRVSLGYNNTDGILKTYNFERTTVSLAVDPTLFNDKLKVSINVKGMFNNNNFTDQAAIGDAVYYDPTQPVFNGNSRWRGYTTWTTGGINGNSINLAPANPVARLAFTDNTSEVMRSIGNIKLDYELPIWTDVHATLNLGYDISRTEGRNNVLDSTQWVYLPTVAGGRLNPYEAEANNELLDFYLSRKTEFNADNKLDVTAGYSWAHFSSSGADSSMNYYGEEVTRVNVYATEYYLLSFFGRANYTFKDKYLFTATLRNDATSRFSPDNRWGLFPAFAFGWKIHEEEFMRNFEKLSQLKLRLSYGITGQQDIFTGDYPYIATYTISDNAARYPFGSTFYNTLRPDGYDANIRWESTTTINGGFDFGFYNNRISGTLDVYQKNSEDLIAYIPVPVGTNFASNLTTNVGSMRNYGVELNLNAGLIQQENFSWSMGYNVTYNQNEITKLNLSGDDDFFIPLGGVGGTTSGTIQAHRIGYPRSAFYVYEQVYDENGRPLEDVYVDRNNDGVINTSDLYTYKQPDPSVLMGIYSNLNYKNWDFSFAGRASFGNSVYNNVAANSTYRALYNSMEYLVNTSQLADLTQFETATNTRFSDYYVENAAFFRMDNIGLGYQFQNMFNNTISRLRLGVGVNNAFVITNYSGLDPEVSGGIDNNFFPRTRSYFFSLNCTL